MTEFAPIHELRDNLQNARLQVVKELAAKDGVLPAEALEKLTVLQTAFTAVDQAIKSHQVRLGHGAETPLR